MSRDYKKEYAEYHSKPEQKKNRAKRNKANRNSNCGPGQEVDHKVPLSAGGSNSPSNWRVVSKETNRKKGTKKMSSFDKLRLAIAEKIASTAGYDDGASTSNYINMSDPKSQKGSGEQGMYREVPILDSPLENRSFLGFDQGPQPYVLSANADKLREELAQIEGLDVAPGDYTENWDEGPLVEYGHLGYALGDDKEKLILEALKRGRISSKEKTAAPEGVERLPSGKLKYRDEIFPGYNKPKAAPKGSKHKKRVLAKKGDKVKVVNFGARGYKHNYSAKAKKSYLARSAGIKGKDDKFSANYWSRKELWPKNQKADGSAKKTASLSGILLPTATGLGGGLLGDTLGGDIGKYVGVAGGVLAGNYLHNKYVSPSEHKKLVKLLEAEKKGPKEVKKAIKEIDAEEARTKYANKEYLNYIKEQTIDFSYMGKIASADDNFDTSDLEVFIQSVKK